MSDRPLFPRNAEKLRSSLLLVKSLVNHFWGDYCARLDRVFLMLGVNRVIKAEIRKMWMELINVYACHLIFKISCEK